jgi:hypothetical protein
MLGAVVAQIETVWGALRSYRNFPALRYRLGPSTSDASTKLTSDRCPALPAVSYAITSDLAASVLTKGD